MMKRSIATLFSAVLASCNFEAPPPVVVEVPEVPVVIQAPREMKVGKVLDAVVIKNIKFAGELMAEAITLVNSHLKRFCEKKNIVLLEVVFAESSSKMSFSSTAMTARMLVKMIASEARMKLEIDDEERVVRFLPNN